ncbi:MAG TPA: hypothetical protein VF832_11495 [Longimicrobiales bacterium]
MTVVEERTSLERELTTRLTQANRYALRYRRTNNLLLLLGIVLGLAATAFAGDAFRGSKALATPVVEATTPAPVPADLPKGWRNVCGLVALMTLLATIANAVNAGLKTSEHQARATACAGAVDALRTQVALGGEITGKRLEEIRGELTRLLRDYAEFFR